MRLTVYAYHNNRFFCGANPRGTVVLFYTRADRDAALARLIQQAREMNLTDPEDFPAWRTTRDGDFLDALERKGVLYANGIDLPQRSPDYAWGDAE